MKILITSLTLFLLSSSLARAHEGEAGVAEFTDVAAADWTGPLVAIFLIVVAFAIARIIKKIK